MQNQYKIPPRLRLRSEWNRVLIWVGSSLDSTFVRSIPNSTLRSLPIVNTPYSCLVLLQHTAPHCNTLCHTAALCTTLHHTLRHTATHCDTLQRHTAVSATWHDWFPTETKTLQHYVTQCNTLQHIATHGNTLQHTATPYSGLSNVPRQQIGK